MDDLVTRLGRVGHFRSLPQTALQAIVEAGQIRRFDAGSTILMEGEPCAGMFVLFAGRVHLCKTSPNGQQQIISIIEPVIMFNEVAVLDGGSNPLTAVAVENCATWCVSCQAFNRLVASYPEVGLGLLPVLALRNRMLIARTEDMSSRSVLARTAKLLLQLSSDGKIPIVRRQHSIDVVAARIGTVREPVSRALRSLRELGIIECTRASIVVKNAEDLAACAGIDLIKPG
jgi:CRP/FNR family transcriptional regulator, dissimilatory nitrate respiration regulator